jgi:hypothetical protein
MPQTSILHNLPLDVIRKHILPSLDWSSRVTANALLDPKDRLRFPLKKDAGISFMMAKEHNIIKKLLFFVTPYNPQEINYTHIVDVMKALKNVTFLLKYSINFRSTFILKCEGFADLQSEEYAASILTEEDKQALSTLCKENLERLKGIPYEREVVSSCKETWTAVGAGPPHIVEQTARVFHGYNSYEEYDNEEAYWSRRED